MGNIVAKKRKSRQNNGANIAAVIVQNSGYKRKSKPATVVKTAKKRVFPDSPYWTRPR
jgi:hypothetical protein